MSRHPRALLLLALLVLATACIEPSKIENAEQLIAAAEMRDGSLGDAGDPAGSGGASGMATSGSGGSGGGSGTSGSGGGGGMATADAGGDCGDIVADLIVPTCATEFCHGAMGASPLKLMAATLPGSLVGTAASTTCADELYIDPDAPEQSLFYTKLGADPPCGLRMPLGGMALSAAQMTCVLEWVTDAAAAQ